MTTATNNRTQTNIKLFVAFVLLVLSSTGAFAQANTTSVATTSTEVSVSKNATTVITTENAVAGDKSGNPSKGDAVKPADSGDNPANAKNAVEDQDEAADATDKKANPATTSVVSDFAVNITIGTIEVVLISRQTSTPSLPGNITSNKTKSGS